VTDEDATGAQGAAAEPDAAVGDPQLLPLDADGVGVITVGTVLWWVAFVVLLVWPDHAGHGGPRGWLAITFAGGTLGIYGIYYTRRRRAAIRRSRQAEGDATPQS
jgi:hypothetical protein